MRVPAEQVWKPLQAPAEDTDGRGDGGPLGGIWLDPCSQAQSGADRSDHDRNSSYGGLRSTDDISLLQPEGPKHEVLIQGDSTPDIPAAMKNRSI